MVARVTVLLKCGFEKADMSEVELFKVMQFLQEMNIKSKNPVIAIQPWPKDVGSKDALNDRIHNQLTERKDGLKEKLKSYGAKVAGKEQ